MTTTQMNIRIGETLKRSGNEVFARIGYTPTRVVRSIWNFAAHHKDDPEAVEKLLLEAERALSPSAEDERARRVTLAERGPDTFRQFLEAAGVPFDAVPVFEEADPAARRERKAVGRAREKGWLNG